MQGAEPTGPGHLWTTAREYLTHWVIAGLILSLTGFVPEEWFAKLVEELALPERVRALWPEGLDPRAAIFALGVAIIVADIVLRRRVAAHDKGAASHAARASAAPPISSGEQAKDGAGANAPRLSMVVLPFVNLSGDPEQEYFVDGITESLTTDLSRLAGSFVIGRNTAFTYKGKPTDLKQIGRELNIRYVLEGSVQRSGNRIRVNVQLIDAETGAHLWSERFDKPANDLFAMQDEIVARLASELSTALIAHEARRTARAPNPDSLDHYFQGMAWYEKAISPRNIDEARRCFERALELDPDNVDALIQLANMEMIESTQFDSDDRAAHRAVAEASLNKALSLAPNHAWGHYVLGVIHTCDGLAEEGIAEFERALDLDRNLARAHAWIGNAKSVLGHPEETEAHVREALRLSPKDSIAYVWMGFAGLAKACVGANEEAILWLRRSIEANPNFAMSRFFLAAALAHLGRLDEARTVAKAGLALNPAATIQRLRIAGSAILENERILEGMRLAGVPAG